MMRRLRQLAHFAISSVGMALWGVAMALMCVCIPLAHAARKIMPESEWQNCWLAVLWKWHKYGGYLAVRPADGTRLLKYLPVPSAIWLQELPRRGVKLEYYAPLNRKYSQCCPLYVGYFKGRIRLADSEHKADMVRYKEDQRQEMIDAPIKRLSSFLLPWYTVNYHGEIRNVEANHNAKESSDEL